MTHRSELINLIAKKIGAKRYLEIGVYNPDHNFNKINVGVKVGVDPDLNAKALVRCTSDEWFRIGNVLGVKMDLVFIDGLHHSDQVKKDIRNAWDCLSPGGVIVLHDCNPPTEATTCIPRGAQREWCGDVYKTICSIKSAKFTVDFDYGCGVIRKSKAKSKDAAVLQFWESECTWELFNANRKDWINLVTVEEARKIISEWT